MDSEPVTHPTIIIIKNKLEDRFFSLYWLIIPCIYFTRALVQYIDSEQMPFALVDSSRIVVELGLLLSILFCHLLFTELPHKLNQLFSSVAFQGSKTDTYSQATFYQQLTTRLNHPYRCIAGTLIVGLMVIYYGTTYNLEILMGRGFWGFLDQVLTVPPILIYNYFVGILAWKYLVISHAIYNLPKHFNFKVQLGYPDKAGGFLSIGLLCMRLVYIPVIPTLISAIELVLGHVGLMELTKSNYVFLMVLLVYGLVGSLIGLAPIFKFHQVMLSQREVGTVMLNQLANHIMHLKGELFKVSVNLEQGTVERLRSDIAAYEAFYSAHQNINTWPINRKVLVGIWVTETFLGGQLWVTWNLISQFF